MKIEVYEAFRDAGVAEDKALRAAEALSKRDDDAATKADLAALRSDLAVLRADMKSEIEQVQAEVASVKGATIQWVAGMLGLQTIAIIGSIIALLRFMLPAMVPGHAP